MIIPKASARHLRPVTVIAQDPSFTRSGQIVKACLSIPAERLEPGPSGARIRVVDYDASTGALYQADRKGVSAGGELIDRFADSSDAELLANPHFHAQNVYAIVSCTLARFERALGRRVSWGFAGHQLLIAPHAMCEANAFYDESIRSLLFGYCADPVAGPEKVVFSCLSHDVIVHETTHALLDGLRDRFTEPSSLAQDGFHEGFSDVVALLSVLSSRELVTALLRPDPPPGAPPVKEPYRLRLGDLTIENLRDGPLFTLADEMGPAINGAGSGPLRRSLSTIGMSTSWKQDPDFEWWHRYGEVLVCAVLNAFLNVWCKRIRHLAGALGREKDTDEIDHRLVAQEAADAAESLLTMMIRALDYTAPTHITYEDFLSAVLTADRETVPDDSRYGYRQILRECFAKLGIKPASTKVEGGVWEAPDLDLRYDRVRFESILRDPEEMFRFIWENRKALKIEQNAYTRVESVRPVMRVGPDGFVMRETVAEYTQRLTVRADRLESVLGTGSRPQGLDDSTPVTLWGGGTLILDEYGRVKYHIRNRLMNRKLQSKRIQYQASKDQLAAAGRSGSPFAGRHLARSLGSRSTYGAGSF
ncbi:MAG: hypothetical protein RJA99_3316 [Pseudomonadota bacterium]|jgi:hypothetical protein